MKIKDILTKHNGTKTAGELAKRYGYKAVSYKQIACKNGLPLKPDNPKDKKADLEHNKKTHKVTEPKELNRKDFSDQKLISLGYRGIYVYVPKKATKSEIVDIKSEKLEYWRGMYGDNIKRCEVKEKNKKIEFPKARELKSGEVLEIKKPADMSFTAFRERAKEYLRNYFSSAYKINYKDKQRAEIALKYGI